MSVLKVNDIHWRPHKNWQSPHDGGPGIQHFSSLDFNGPVFFRWWTSVHVCGRDLVSRESVIAEEERSAFPV